MPYMSIVWHFRSRSDQNVKFVCVTCARTHVRRLYPIRWAPKCYSTYAEETSSCLWYIDVDVDWFESGEWSCAMNICGMHIECTRVSVVLDATVVTPYFDSNISENVKSTDIHETIDSIPFGHLQWVRRNLCDRKRIWLFAEYLCAYRSFYHTLMSQSN